jgi:hypothetical protein
MSLYECKCVAYPRPIERLESETSFAARKAYAERHGCDVLDVIARRVDLIDTQWTNRHGYNPVAVNKAIEASNRSGRRIGAREAKAIHALLKGR